jgi:RNA polymerase sigma-70 factor, ECF subfamily
MGIEKNFGTAMDTAGSVEITRLLKAWNSGDRAALERLLPAVYQELRRRARAYMRHQPSDHTLQPTALVHEAVLQLVDTTAIDWQDRAHFFAVCAQVMRRILVDSARARGAAKRGGGKPKVNMDDVPGIHTERDREIVAIDEALEVLAAMDPRKARVIELRFFGGLSVEETAAALDVSPQTVMRDWKLARAWLTREITGRA